MVAVLIGVQITQSTFLSLEFSGDLVLQEPMYFLVQSRNEQ